MSLDATVGGSSSNSYVTVLEADAYFADRLYASAWTGDDKATALVTAARRLDQEDYLGYRATNEQAMKWPRYDTGDEDGRWYASDSIPQPVRDAQCELALYLLETDGLKQSRLSNFVHLKIGPLDLTPKHPQTSGSLPAVVVRLLRHLLATSPGTIRMVRG